jgi:hypothetical protein
MSGAVFHPVNLHPNGSALSEDNTPNAVDPSFMILGQGGSAVDFVALKADVDDIETMLSELKTDFNAHGHLKGAGCLGTAATGGPATVVSGTPTISITNSYTVTASSKVKVQ